MNITMLFLILSWCYVSFIIIFLWHCEQQNPGVWPINLISDDISYILCLNPNIWSTLILLYWIVTVNIWFGYDMPFYKINWSSPNSQLSSKIIVVVRKSNAKSGSWFESHNLSALWLNILGFSFPMVYVRVLCALFC